MIRKQIDRRRAEPDGTGSGLAVAQAQARSVQIAPLQRHDLARAGSRSAAGG